MHIPVAKQNKIFYIKMISQNIFYFSNFHILSFLLFQKTNNPVNFFKNVFATFSKNRQFGDLFEKRFAGGICDLGGGYRPSSASNPINIKKHFIYFFSITFYISGDPILLPPPLVSGCDLTRGGGKSIGCLLSMSDPLPKDPQKNFPAAFGGRDVT